MFSNFFKTKIEKNCDNLISNQKGDDPHSWDKTTAANLSTFKSVTISEVKKLISASPNKQCSLDPTPTWLIKECANELAPIFTKVINSSLNSSTVPQEMNTKITATLQFVLYIKTSGEGCG